MGKPLIKGADGIKRPADNWHILWSEKGRSVRRSTGTPDEVAAREVLKRWQAARSRPPVTITVNTILDAYVKMKEEDGKPVANIKSALVRIRAHFGTLLWSEITPSYVRDYIRMRRTETKRRGKRGGGTIAGVGIVSDRAISVELAYLRAGLKWAEHEHWIEKEKTPFIKLPAGAGVKARMRSLSRDEVEILLKATLHPDTAPHIRLFVVLALYTAQRGVAVRDLTWSHVDFEGNTIFFSATGGSLNKRRANIPMTPSLAAELRKAKEVSRSRGGFVIEYRDERVRDVKTGFANLVARAGLKDVHIHDLRRTAATLALRGGQSFDRVAAMLAQDVHVTQAHYAHASPDYLMAVAMTILGVEGAERVEAVPLLEPPQNSG